MGGTSGTTTPAGQTSTGNATINNSQLNWPEWATNFAATIPQSPMAPVGSTAAGAGDPVADLGFPSPTAAPTSADAMMAPTGFNADVYMSPVTDGSSELAHMNAGAAPGTGTGVEDAGLPATGPNAPITQQQLQQEFLQPHNPVYEDTQVSAYTLPGGTYGSSGVQTPSVYAPGTGYVDPEAYKTFGTGWGPYLDPRSDPYYAYSWAKSQANPLTPGQVLTPEQQASQPHMSKALYDFNMQAYGNPYGPAQQQADRELYNRLLAQYRSSPAGMSASEMSLGGGGNYGGGA